MHDAARMAFVHDGGMRASNGRLSGRCPKGAKGKPASSQPVDPDILRSGSQNDTAAMATDQKRPADFPEPQRHGSLHWTGSSLRCMIAIPRRPGWEALEHG
jgi:hypothetical protein